MQAHNLHNSAVSSKTCVKYCRSFSLSCTCHVALLHVLPNSGALLFGRCNRKHVDSLRRICECWPLHRPAIRLEYKFIVCNFNGSTSSWQPGPNCILVVPDQAATLEVHEAWGDSAHGQHVHVEHAAAPAATVAPAAIGDNNTHEAPQIMVRERKSLHSKSPSRSLLKPHQPSNILVGPGAVAWDAPPCDPAPYPPPPPLIGAAEANGYLPNYHLSSGAPADLFDSRRPPSPAVSEGAGVQGKPEQVNVLAAEVVEMDFLLKQVSVSSGNGSYRAFCLRDA
jgi:hypothetical protein